MPAWMIVLLIKPILFAGMAFASWLVAVKGGGLLAKLIPSKKWREIMTRERYSFSLSGRPKSKSPARRR